MLLTAEEKKRFLRALEEDREFRYSVAGLLGYEEVLKRLDSLAEEQVRLAQEQMKLREEQVRIAQEQVRLAQEQMKLREEQVRIAQEQAKLREDFNRMLERIAKIEDEQAELREGQARLMRLYEDIRGAMFYGFSQLSKFAGVTFEDFVRDLLTKQYVDAGFLPYGRELKKVEIEGEEINIFCEEPLLVGEVTAHAESVDEASKLLRKVDVVEKKFGKPVSRKILIVLTAPKRVADELRRLCRENGIEFFIGKTL
ncbi:MAG: hypothetical protein NZ954_04990 [Thermofilaceae archaeon]|nr:hypothetical protein [Thermofilaceae archaeon]MCX8180162.1 hypothetical protein [Thermofilaceae archaeon]MDW8004182.1 hypothetical protein [Thermofilaceae archaeon]